MKLQSKVLVITFVIVSLIHELFAGMAGEGMAKPTFQLPAPREKQVLLSKVQKAQMETSDASQGQKSSLLDVRSSQKSLNVDSNRALRRDRIKKSIPDQILTKQGLSLPDQQKISESVVSFDNLSFKETNPLRGVIDFSPQELTKTDSIAQAQDFYARMGISFKAVVDAFSKITLGTIQKIMNYLNRVKNQNDIVIEDHSNPMHNQKTLTEALMIQSAPDAAQAVAQLPIEQVKEVLKMVRQDPVVMQAAQPMDISVIHEPVENVKADSFTLPVETVEPVDITQQELRIIEQDGNSFKDQLKFAEKDLKDQRILMKQQSKKSSLTSDTTEAIKRLKFRIKLLKEKNAEQKAIERQASVLPDHGILYSKKTVDVVKGDNPIAKADIIPAPTQPVVDERSIEFDQQFSAVNPMKESVTPSSPVTQAVAAVNIAELANGQHVRSL